MTLPSQKIDGGSITCFSPMNTGPESVYHCDRERDLDALAVRLIGNTDVSGGQEVANHIGPGSQLIKKHFFNKQSGL